MMWLMLVLLPLVMAASIVLSVLMVTSALEHSVDQVTKTLGGITDRILNPPREAPPENGHSNDAMEMFNPPWETWEPGVPKPDPSEAPGG